MPLPDRLNVPRVEVRDFPRNYLRQVVCELRYPEILEFNSKRIKEIAQALRKRLPLYDASTEVSLTPGEDAPQRIPQHEFGSRNGKTAFVIRTSALILRTTAYTTFDAFSSDLRLAVGACEKLIDTDFFTRVGLRYINAIEIPEARDPGQLEEWVRPDLVRALADGHYGRVFKYVQEVRGNARARGQYTFRHGFPERTVAGQEVYTLDFDFSDEGVDIGEVFTLLDSFRLEAYDFFAWAAGPATIRAMSASSPTQ